MTSDHKAQSPFGRNPQIWHDTFLRPDRRPIAASGWHSEKQISTTPPGSVGGALAHFRSIRGFQSDGSSFSRAVYPRRNFPRAHLVGRVGDQQLF